MTPGLLLFAVCSLLCLGGAVSTVTSINPIRGALGLLTTIIGIAGLFLRLNAEFLAAMQILVYAGAVVILFVFVVMLLGPTASLPRDAGRRSFYARAISGGLGAGVAVLLFALLSSTGAHSFPVVGKAHGTVEAVGAQIFKETLVPFELATALLIVAAVGAIAVARSNPQKGTKKHIENPTIRLFHGPLLARDAGYPLDGRTLEERYEADPNRGDDERRAS
jgi:NADH-quinone oxidoreductase subunit J